MDPAKQEELSQLYQVHRDSIYRYLLKLCRDTDLAADLTHEVYFNILKSKSEYSQERGSFTTWSLTIARNLYFNYHKRETRQVNESALDGAFEQISPTSPDIAHIIEEKIISREIKGAIACLPEDEKNVILLKIEHNLSLQEAATRLGVSTRTISRRLLRAYDLLRRELQAKEIVP